MSASAIHVMKDELGVLREYREVKRMANVGERVKVVQFSEGFGPEDGYNIGDVYNVTSVEENGNVDVDGTFDDGDTLFLCAKEYVVLEPTDIVIIDGVRYREEHRKARVGERVLIVSTHGCSEESLHVGEIVTITETDEMKGWACTNRPGTWMVKENYVALMPIDDPKAETSTTPAVYNVTINVTVIGSIDDAIRAVEKQMREALAKVKPPTADEIIREIKPPAKSPQQLRDEIVERAKADVAELVERTHENVPTIYGGKVAIYSKSLGDRVRFVVNREKRSVVALLEIDDGDERFRVWGRGKAKCAPNDCFNVYIGKAIALRRALGLPVPDEYVNAPQPTEVRVGDVVLGIRGAYKPGTSGVVTGFEFDGVLYKNEHARRRDGNIWTYAKYLKIIDDSREEVSA